MNQQRKLINSLLDASLCTTREEAREIIKRADQSSISLGGLAYGFSMEIKDEVD